MAEPQYNETEVSETESGALVVGDGDVDDAVDAEVVGEPDHPAGSEPLAEPDGSGESDDLPGLDDDAAEEGVPELDRDQTRQALHALLFVSDRPLSAARMAEALGDLDAEMVTLLLEELRGELESGPWPYTLREIAGGYQFATRAVYAPYISRLLQIKKRNRLSRSALETLAIVAYKQPCTRAEVEEIRGVSVSHAFEILLEKRLIKVAGVAEVVGRPKLYRTTDEFLAHFGLQSLKELPSVEELRETL